MVDVFLKLPLNLQLFFANSYRCIRAPIVAVPSSMNILFQEMIDACLRYFLFATLGENI